MPDQIDPPDQVAVEAPAHDAGGGDRGDELCVECEVAYGFGPGVGHDDADRAQMA